MLWKIVQLFHKPRGSLSPGDSTPRYFPEKNEMHVYTGTCTQMFTEALFIAAKRRKLTCPSTDEWIHQTVLYPYNGTLFGHEKEEYSTNTTRVNLQIIKPQKITYCIILFI